MTFPHIVTLDEIEATVSQSNDSQQTNPDGQNGTTPATPATPTPPATGMPQTDALREALRISEEARLDLASRLNQQQNQQQQQQQPQHQEQWYTREQIAQLINSEDPNERLMGMEIHTNQALRLASNHLEQRLAPLTQNNLFLAQNSAEQRYPLEFSLYKDQIASLVNQVPDKSQLTTASGWDNLIAYVRGLPGNIDKYVSAVNQRQAEDARKQQQAQLPFAPTPTLPAQSGNSQMVVDDVTKSIARGLGYDSVEAYLKDYNLYNKSAFNG